MHAGKKRTRRRDPSGPSPSRACVRTAASATRRFRLVLQNYAMKESIPGRRLLVALPVVACFIGRTIWRSTDWRGAAQTRQKKLKPLRSTGVSSVEYGSILKIWLLYTFAGSPATSPLGWRLLKPKRNRACINVPDAGSPGIILVSFARTQNFFFYKKKCEQTQFI